MQVLKEIREDYNTTRQAADQEWQKWLEQQQSYLQAQQESLENIQKQRKLDGTDAATLQAAADSVAQKTLMVAEQELIKEIRQAFTQPPQTTTAE